MYVASATSQSLPHSCLPGLFEADLASTEVQPGRDEHIALYSGPGCFSTLCKAQSCLKQEVFLGGEWAREHRMLQKSKAWEQGQGQQQTGKFPKAMAKMRQPEASGGW